MTVLRQNTAAGYQPQRGKKMIVGLAMVVAGAGAAFGISRVADFGTTAPASQVDRADDVHRARAAETSATAGAGVRTLEEELAAIREFKAQESGSLASSQPETAVWTLENELAAIRSITRSGQPVATQSAGGPR